MLSRIWRLELTYIHYALLGALWQPRRVGWRVGSKFKERIYAYVWLIHVVYQKISQHCKAIIFKGKKKNRENRIINFGPWVRLCLNSLINNSLIGMPKLNELICRDLHGVLYSLLAAINNTYICTYFHFPLVIFCTLGTL